MVGFNHPYNQYISLKSTCQEGSVEMKTNQTVREAAKRKGVKLWQIAVYLGISEPTMTRWLRSALSPDRENAILKAIDEIAEGVA